MIDFWLRFWDENSKRLIEIDPNFNKITCYQMHPNIF